MNRRILAGNWKMNTTPKEGEALARELMEFFSENNPEFPVLLFPPATHLANISKITASIQNLSAGAQNAHSEEKGAFTGEISVPMIKEAGAEYLLVGHSERRTLFNENDDFLLKKTEQALKQGLKVVFCFGEALEAREADNYLSFVQEQLEKVVFKLSEVNMGNIVLAYEPIWAIGTGKNAQPEQAQEVHAFVRKILAEKYGTKIAETTSILYGGSCKPSNAKAIFAQKDVDGGLIGGASLKAEDFIQLYKLLNAKN
ncbi:MAG: triose-phosphate isomerase [Chitinophagales bacterium]